MSKPQFVYVIYIKTTAEKLWDALTDPEMNKKYWFGAHQESEWTAGSSWKIVFRRRRRRRHRRNHRSRPAANALSSSGATNSDPS